MRLGSVSIHRSVHASRDVLPAHEHRAAYLSLVIEGEYVEALGSTSVACRAWQVRLHPAGEVHSNVFGARGAHVLNLQLEPRWNAELESLGLSNPDDAVLVNDGVWPALRAWREARQPAGRSALVLEEMVAILLNKACGARREAHAARARPVIRRAVDFLHATQDRRVSLFDVAKTAGVHSTHLARVFRREMGCTVGTYARRLRAVRSLESMRHYPRWPLSRIAAETGFTDHAHYTRVFRTVFGVVPSQVRLLAREIVAADAQDTDLEPTA
jgi:AraC family transcriptional regulator